MICFFSSALSIVVFISSSLGLFLADSEYNSLAVDAPLLGVCLLYTSDMSLKDYQISFNMTEYLDFSGSDEASYTSMMKVMAMASAHDLDVFGGNTAFVNYYGVGEEDNTLFADLEETLPPAFFQYLKEQDRICLLYTSRCV